MEFDYDPYGNLKDFCSTSFDDKMRKETTNLAENVSLNDSTQELIIIEEDKSAKELKKEELLDLLDDENDLMECLPKKKGKKTSKKNLPKTDKIAKEIVSEKAMKISATTTPKKKKRRSLRQANLSPNHNDTNYEVNSNLLDLNVSTTSRSQLGRARRNYMANLVTSLPTQDTINLESVLQAANQAAARNVSTNVTSQRRGRRKGSNRRGRNNHSTILIGSGSEQDSDHGEIKITSNAAVEKFNADDDEDNPEIQILIEWGDKIEKHRLRKYQKFADLMDIFAKREKVTVKDILFNLGNNIITENDTYESLNYKFGDVICGRVVQNCLSILSGIGNTTPKVDHNKTTNEICLKIQSNLWKRSIDMQLRKTDTFKILYIKCAESFKLNISDFVLMFDGDKLNLNQTPENLDMEGDEIIDLVKKTK